MPISPGSYTQLPPNSTGPKLATGATYTENAQVVQDEKVILGEAYLASYILYSGPASTATGNSHLLQIMAGAARPVRIRRIELYQGVLATVATLELIGLYRLATAGTGGSAVIANSPLDPADPGSPGFTGMVLPTAKGTEGNLVGLASGILLQTVGASTVMQQPWAVWDFDRPRSKPLIIAAGAANGLAIKSLVACAGADLRAVVWADDFAWA